MKQEWKVITQSETEKTEATEGERGILIRTSFLSEEKVTATSILQDKEGVIVNHGTVEAPVWKLNR